MSGVLLLGLFAFPGTAGQDPYHLHIVLGGTPAERARALMLHILREQAGIDGMETPGPAAAGRAANHVRVRSIRANNNDAGGVFSAEITGALLAAGRPPVPVPTGATRIAADRPLGVLRTALCILDPPPRHA